MTKKETPGGELDAQAGRKNVAQAITRMLERHGIAPREHLRAIEKITGIAYDSVRRRMIGTNAWNPEELVELAQHFGESALAIYGHALYAGQAQRAMVEVADLSVPCTVWLGARFDRHKTLAQWVAIEPATAHDYWRVLPSSQAGDRPAYLVECMLYGGVLRKVRVAIVDHDQDFVASAIEFLRDRGIQGVGFTDIPAFAAALKRSGNRFDGFIVDWSLMKPDHEAIERGVRKNNDTAALIVRVPKLEEDDPVLAASVSAARALVYERTTSLVALLYALKLGFSRVGANT